jgi:hypothetical protein
MNNFSNQWLRRILVLLFTFVAIFGSAASCNLFGEDSSSLRFGILKSDPEVYQGGFAFINNVKNFKDYVDSKGLNTQSGIKLIQFNKDKLYYIALNKGLFKTSNAGKEWSRIYLFPIKGDNKKTWDDEIVKNDAFKINDVSFINEDNFYVSGSTNDIAYVYKTTDAGQTFTEVYNTQANNKKVFIEQVLADPRADKSNNVYITTSGGSVFRSEDAGASWKIVNIEGTAGDIPLQMGNLSNYGNKFFILFKNSGLYLSDNGESYSKKEINFAKSNTNDIFGYGYYSGQQIDKVVQSPNTTDLVLIANKALYLGGNLDSEFNQIKIPVEPEKINITDIAIDPREGVNRLLMTVDNKLYESKDRGASWSGNDRIKQPNVQYGNIGQMIIDPEDTRVVYLMLIDPSYRRGSSAGSLFGF